jgi:hypothetical protein
LKSQIAFVLVPFLLFLSLVVPSAAQGFATIYEHTAAFGPDAAIRGDVTIKFSDGTNTEFECRLDGGSWTACTDPKTYTGLTDGPHNFGVRTLGDTAVATFSWVTDNTGPTVNIASGPPALTSSKSASFTFNWTDLHPDGGYVLCSLDAQPLNSSCTSPKLFSDLADGDRRLNVAAVDGVGNVSQTAVYQWTVDTTPPDTLFTLKPNAATYDTSADFGLSSFPEPPPTVYECSLDGAAYSPCGSSKSYTGLAPGSHTFSARAIDRVNLVDPTPATWTWTVLTPPAAPDTTITEGPSGTVASTTALFRFSSSTPSANFECSLDGSGFVPCSEGYYTDLGEGSHTFAVRAVNSLGTPDPTPATRNFTVNPGAGPGERHTLTANKAGSGGGSVASSPSGINCGVDCSEDYDNGTLVTLTATPGPGSTFTGWSGAGCSGTGTCAVTLNSDQTATANFAAVTTDKALLSRLVVTGPVRVSKGKSATYKVAITNTGKADATGVRLNASGRGVSSSANVGRIAAGKATSVNVRLKPRIAGRIKVSFKVTSSNGGNKTVSKTITVRG